MSSPPTERDFIIRRGRTFLECVRWGTSPSQSVAIASIDNGPSVQITTVDPHGLMPGWPVAVVGARGLTELNALENPPAKSDARAAMIVDATRIKFDKLSAADFGRHRAGTGFVVWDTPHELAGYVARMSIKNRAGGTVLLTSLDSGPIAIELDDSTKTISLRIEASATEPLTWKAGTYDLELEAPDGTVTVILTGSITVVQEVTTPIT